MRTKGQGVQAADAAIAAYRGQAGELENERAAVRESVTTALATRLAHVKAAHR